MTCKICQTKLELLHKDLFDDRYGFPGLFSVYVCPRCSFAQTLPEPSAAQLSAIYTDYYPRKDISTAGVQRSAIFTPGWIFQFKSWLMGTRNTCHYHVQTGQRVLDVGCGDGASLLDIQKAGAEAYGTEYDRNVEPIAQQLHLRIFFGNVKDASYPDNYFDTITMSQLLEHISDPISFIYSLKRLLKPGGQIIMAFPNRLGFNGKRSDRKWINWHIPYHLNFFSRKSLEILAQKTGLTLSSIRTYTPNVWLQLQTMNTAYPAKMGVPSPVWMPLAKAQTIDQTSQQPIWKRKVRTGLAMLHSYGRIPLTRWQDAIGQGDSFLVVLEKPE